MALTLVVGVLIFVSFVRWTSPRTGSELVSFNNGGQEWGQNQFRPTPLIRRHAACFHYTLANFHLPRLNNHSVNSPTEVSDTNTPQNTPSSCQPKWIASR